MRLENTDRDLDIVQAILELVAATTPDLTPEKVRDIETAVRAKYGGLRSRIAKRKQHPTNEQRDKAVRDALAQSNVDVPTDQIAENNGISRRTLYRYLKRGA
jgi:DNA invertase Pin-like site-specific DNA recombinase